MQAPDVPVTWESLRAFALSLDLPNVEDAISWGYPNLKAHGKMWAWWVTKEDCPVFKTTFEEREFLIEVDPDTYFYTSHYKSWPLILARPEHVQWDWIRANLNRVWRQQAKKTWLKKWDAEQSLLSTKP